MGRPQAQAFRVRSAGTRGRVRASSSCSPRPSPSPAPPPPPPPAKRPISARTSSSCSPTTSRSPEFTPRVDAQDHAARSPDERGPRSTDSIVSSPLCCPSRAGFLTGPVPHNSGVFDNEPGYAAPQRQGIDGLLLAAGRRLPDRARRPLPAQLRPRHAAGRRLARPTAASRRPAGPRRLVRLRRPPHLLLRRQPERQRRPAHRRLGSSPATRPASSTVRRSTSSTAPRTDPRPFFLMLAHVAPHASQTRPARAHVGSAGCPSPTAASSASGATPRCRSHPSFDERNLVRQAELDLPPGPRSAPAVATPEARGRCANASLATVDDGVAQIVRELRRDGELDNTAIFFTSDNGYLFGEHRVLLNKVYPYEESLRVPLLARVPTACSGRQEAPGARRRQPRSTTST